MATITKSWKCRTMYVDANPNLDYLKLFLFGKKTDQMIKIEKDYPYLGGFDRRTSILSAIGCPSIHFKNGWLMFLPVRQEFEYINKKEYFSISCFLFSFYWCKRQISDSVSQEKKE